MRRTTDSYDLSASDLAKHLACAHVTEVDRTHADGRLNVEPWRDPAVEHLQKRGFAHEENYVEHLRAAGRSIADLRDRDHNEASTREAVLDAMRSGVDVIVQAPFSSGRWRGIADLLFRVDTPSALGAWSYEIADTKLATGTKGGTVLQLCLYTDLLGELQGATPKRMHVVKPGEPFETETFRFAEFEAYYRHVKARLEATLEQPEEALYARTYPEPCSHCDVCRWWKMCDDKRRADDHPSLVAGLGRIHTTELRRQGRGSLATFAAAETALDEPPTRGNRETFERLHAQARIQARGRDEKADVHELLPAATPSQGLSQLPEPDAGDVFFDIEGDHFFEGGGLEYLFGVTFEEDGATRYRGWWALDRSEEKRAYEALIDFLIARWERHPGMHVYHFAPYEPAACKRLMGRHATRQVELDRLLRGLRFVDLHAITKQGVRASVESYNLKDLERFAGFERQVDLREASAMRRAFAWALELGDREATTEEQRTIIEGYNREDCEATAALRDWLEERRAELVARDGPLPRRADEDGEPSENVTAKMQRIEAVIDALRARIPTDEVDWTDDDRAVGMLANLLAYFLREDRCNWWEYFRMLDLDPDERMADRKAIEGLEFVKDLGKLGSDRVPTHRFRFPRQEFDAKVGDKLKDLEQNGIGSIVELDLSTRTLDVKRTGKTVGLFPTAVFAHDNLPTKNLEDSLLAFGEDVATRGIDADGAGRAARTLLRKLAPRVPTHKLGNAKPVGEEPAAEPCTSLRIDDERAIDAARRIAPQLGGDILAIQGPPGTGKTHVGSRMIVDLVRAGKRVGVTAVSHRVIRNLVEKALEAARDPENPGPPIEGFLKTKSGAPKPELGLDMADDNRRAVTALADGKLVGGTSWLWARDDIAEVGVDYLFVDEAGQLSLAATLAAAHRAKNLVLLGDPQQLQQPQRAAHPDGAEIAALTHYLDGAQTMPLDKGLFLDESWRLPKAISTFTSELYYEGRLESHARTIHQTVFAGDALSEPGLYYLPTLHEGRQARAPEEVAAVRHVVDTILSRDSRWRDEKGEHPLTAADLLVIAPYNSQVSALKAALPPNVRVGTVDKFQGQEAPVVLYSLTSSTIDDAPRGLSFLLDPHRMNVATSRAQCACILIASPALLEASPSSPDSMRLANGLCRYVAAATELCLDDIVSSDEELIREFIRTDPQPDGSVHVLVREIEWDGPHTPTSTWTHTTTAPDHDSLAETIQSVLANRRYFAMCATCNERNPKGWMHDARVCSECAERELGVVY